jgi:hypothetical protein
MTKNSQLLNDIYDYAEKNLLIKNKAAFAKYIGFSRGHVDKVIKSEKGAPDEWVIKAKELLKDKKSTNNVFSNDNPTLIKKGLPDILSENQETIQGIIAGFRVLKARIVKLEAQITKKTFDSVLLEVDRDIRDELKHDLEELSRKQ